jgi:hypothetical protein
MAWFRNHYSCEECGYDWEDEWSCTCDDDCPHCGSRHYSPHDSEDLSVIVEAGEADRFVVYYSPATAEDKPSYVRFACIIDTFVPLFVQIAIDLTGADQKMSSDIYDANGWLEEVANCVLRLGKVEFTLTDMYGFEGELAKKYPRNNHIREKIRQQLQKLRDQKKLEFLGDGIYKLK